MLVSFHDSSVIFRQIALVYALAKYRARNYKALARDIAAPPPPAPHRTDEESARK